MQRGWKGKPSSMAPSEGRTGDNLECDTGGHSVRVSTYCNSQPHRTSEKVWSSVAANYRTLSAFVRTRRSGQQFDFLAVRAILLRVSYSLTDYKTALNTTVSRVQVGCELGEGGSSQLSVALHLTVSSCTKHLLRTAQTANCWLESMLRVACDCAEVGGTSGGEQAER